MAMMILLRADLGRRRHHETIVAQQLRARCRAKRFSR
jgi:hypothetical protein